MFYLTAKVLMLEVLAKQSTDADASVERTETVHALLSLGEVSANHCYLIILNNFLTRTVAKHSGPRSNIDQVN